MKRITKNMGKGDFDMIQIKYDIVGSFLRPEAIKKARAEFKSGAITREDLKKKNITTNNHFGENKIEIWRYSPFFLTKGHYVDKLSLYLSLKNNDDERIQIELENLINDIKW